MEEFDFTRRVSVTQGKHDKISIGLRSLYLHTTNIQAFKQFLAIPPREDRSNDPPASDFPTYGWLFNRSSANPRMEIRRSDLDPFYLEGKPLLSGQFFVSNAYTDSTLSVFPDNEAHTVQLPIQTRHHISCKALQLNPTRYIRHFYHRQDSENLAFAHRNLLSASDVSLPNDDEFALDGEDKDNWIPSSQLLRLTPELVQQHLSDCVNGAFQAIASEIDRAKRVLCLATQEVAVFQNTPSYTLDRVETYWEFHSADATTRVRQLGELLHSLGESSNNTFYPGNLHNETRKNSFCFRFELRSGVMLRIYPKTPIRIRMEIEHNFQKYNFAHPNPINTQSDVIEKLEFVRQMAAEELNRVLEKLDGVGRVPPYSHPAIHFLFLFANSVSDKQKGPVILSLLVSNKRVCAGRKNPLFESLTELTEAGILVKSGSIYSPSPPCRYAVNLLSDEKMETLRFYHRRRTSIFVRRVRPQP